MTQAPTRKAKILPIHEEEAAALKRLFETRSKMSQSAFAAEYGLGTQGNVWQYLNAKIPLNARAAVRFAQGLSVAVSDFSPRLASSIEELVQTPSDASSTWVDVEADHAPIRMIDAKASAGRGKVVYSDDVSKLLMFRRDWLAKKDAKPDQVLAFPVDGLSMVDAHIPHDSVVLANTNKREPVSGKIYVLWIDGELYVKELVKDGDSWIARSHNKAQPDVYPDIPIDIDDRIVGRAFWCGFEM